MTPEDMTPHCGVTTILREHLDKHKLGESTRKILKQFVKDVDAGRRPSYRTQQLVSCWLKSVTDDEG